MLEIKVGGEELYNEQTEEFFNDEVVGLTLEHSLASMSKWESKWEIPFLDTQKKTTEQVLDYVKQMIVGPEPAPEVFAKLSGKNILEINTYINAKMSATWVHEPKNAQAEEIITAELIYYWMIALSIPFECQYWHLNKLLMLIKVCNIKNSPKKTMGFNEQAMMQRDLNEQRRAQFGSKG